ncbi:hypothetical protein [Hamadaea tsunoensis]|uniref:hypothetical protein n=1 Tax=Hamadaea tsunoensis TaxID=53368 RepID=UPI00040EC5A6|nr:hypothetical protein [Hamadaea tsunoensis]
MTITPTLRATVNLPADRFQVTTVDRRTRLLVPGDDALRVYDLGALADGRSEPEAEFPAPWPHRAGGPAAVSPDLEFAVFPGVHALRAVDRFGGTRWELSHSCWQASCVKIHAEYADYAGVPDHKYPDSGSAWVGADGSIVWAHVRGPLAGDELHEDFDPFDDADERWLVLSAADGRVLGSVRTETAAHGSRHLPHDDARAMALGIGEGQDGAPLFLGRFDGETLTAERIGADEFIGLAVAPSGRVLISVGHSRRGELNIHELPGGAVIGSFFAELVTGREDHRWDLYGLGFVDGDRLVAATSEAGYAESGGRHWLLDTRRLTLAEIDYPEPVTGRPIGLGDGTWITVAGTRLRIWTV